MNEHRYALKYTWLPETKKGGYTREELEDKGGADALIGISIILPPDGSYSQAVFSIDGKENRDLTQKEIFKAWLMLGLSLHDRGELKGWQKDFVKMHSEMIRAMFNHSSNCETLKNCSVGHNHE